MIKDLIMLTPYSLLMGKAVTVEKYTTEDVLSPWKIPTCIYVDGCASFKKKQINPK